MGAGLSFWKGSGRNVIDHDVNEPVVADEIRGLTEGIATAGQRIARAGDSGDHLSFLAPAVKARPGTIESAGVQAPRSVVKLTRETLCHQRWPGLVRISHEYKEWRRIRS